MNFFDKMNKASQPTRDKVAALAAAQAEHRKNMGDHTRKFQVQTRHGHYDVELTLQDLHEMSNIFASCATMLHFNMCNGYICHAIEAQRKSGEIKDPIAEKARKYVMASISPYFTMGSWLNHTYGQHFNDNAALRARIEWCDKTVKRFEQILREEHYPF